MVLLAFLCRVPAGVLSPKNTRNCLSVPQAGDRRWLRALLPAGTPETRVYLRNGHGRNGTLHTKEKENECARAGQRYSAKNPHRGQQGWHRPVSRRAIQLPGQSFGSGLKPFEKSKQKAGLLPAFQGPCSRVWLDIV